MDELVGTQLGQYQLTALIRRGGMSMVYKAFQSSLERYVAIKVLLPMEDAQFAARFKREARAIAQLQHPNILPIYDYGEQNGLLYIVLQYIADGVTLSDLLDKPLEPTRALRLTRGVLEALDYAHQRAIVHRDIKPGNILMPSPTWPLLGDFGIAKLLTESHQLTLPNVIIGTAAYIAPEQATGQPIDARTDLYSLGVVLFEMLTGHVPFEADTTMAAIAKHAYEQPPTLRSFNPSIPPMLEDVVGRALAKNPNQRYQSATEMCATLDRVVAQLEHSRTQNEIAALYQSGVQAFRAGQWAVAVEHLTRLVALDGSYEDATGLLEVARSQQEQAKFAASTPPAAHPTAPQPVPSPNPPRRPPRATVHLPTISDLPTQLTAGTAPHAAPSTVGVPAIETSAPDVRGGTYESGNSSSNTPAPRGKTAKGGKRNAAHPASSTFSTHTNRTLWLTLIAVGIVVLLIIALLYQLW